MRFVKMQSVGNDYVVLDAFEGDIHHPSPDLVRALCDRHYGIGADGLILMAPPPPDDAECDGVMTIINADGAPGGMCGNGLRCAAKLLFDRGHASPDTHNRLFIRIADRVVTANVHLGDDRLVEAATVDMGAPILEPGRVPVEVLALEPVRGGDPREFLIDGVAFVPVSMGNPHAVVFTDEPERLLFTLGPAWELHRAFPERTNVQFVQVVSRGEAVVLSWERGVGHTLGCGTGACAAVVAGVLTGRLDRDPVIRMPGGEVIVRWDAGSGHVSMTGPAQEVFQGVWPDF